MEAPAGGPPGPVQPAGGGGGIGWELISVLHRRSGHRYIYVVCLIRPRALHGPQIDTPWKLRVQLASSLLGIFSQRLIPRIAGGQVLAYELLVNNNAVSNLIREKRTHEIDVVIETGMESGMVDLNRSLISLVQAGEISMENANLNSLNPKALERLMK